MDERPANLPIDLATKFELEPNLKTAARFHHKVLLMGSDMTRRLSAKEKKHDYSITKDDVKKAIYVDFECFKDKPPTLIGFYCEGEFSQIVCDPDLRPAANAKNISVADAKQTIKDLLKRAISEGRRMVAYSQHEKNVCTEFLEVDLAAAYADARMIAAKWLKRVKKQHPDWRNEHPNWEIERKLNNFLGLIDYPLPYPHGTSEIEVFGTQDSTADFAVTRF